MFAVHGQITVPALSLGTRLRSEWIESGMNRNRGSDTCARVGCGAFDAGWLFWLLLKTQIKDTHKNTSLLVFFRWFAWERSSTRSLNSFACFFHLLSFCFSIFTFCDYFSLFFLFSRDKWTTQNREWVWKKETRPAHTAFNACNSTQPSYNVE